MFAVISYKEHFLAYLLDFAFDYSVQRHLPVTFVIISEISSCDFQGFQNKYDFENKQLLYSSLDLHLQVI